jgi:hydrogenase nickel incorporation protein HypB
MILDKQEKNQRFNHHKDFDKPHHTHSNHPPAEVSTPKSTTRQIKVVRRVLDVNAKMAEQNRKLFSEKGVFVLNVMSSPGSGKTTTLEKTLAQIMPEIKSAVIVGDICTTHP